MIQFQVNVPLDDDTLIAHVKHALSLGLPELRDFEYSWDGTLKVIASGPSARQADLSGKTAAINGALRLFAERDVAPTYWIACDPQEKVVEFLGAIPEETVYLVASKCHPAVFERLKNRNVVLWHVHDEATWPLIADRYPVSRGVSVTICAFEVWARLGWRKFDIWGWDGCIMDGKANVIPQDNGGGEIMVHVDDRKFLSTTVWALEAQDATMWLRGFPFPIHIHGGGLTGAILRSGSSTHVTEDPLEVEEVADAAAA